MSSMMIVITTAAVTFIMTLAGTFAIEALMERREKKHPRIPLKESEDMSIRHIRRAHMRLGGNPEAHNLIGIRQKLVKEMIDEIPPQILQRIVRLKKETVETADGKTVTEYTAMMMIVEDDWSRE